MKTYTKDELEKLRIELGDTTRLRQSINAATRNDTLQKLAGILLFFVLAVSWNLFSDEIAWKRVIIICSLCIIFILFLLLNKEARRKRNVALRLALQPKISEIAQSISQGITYRCGSLIITREWIVNLAEFYSEKFMQVRECRFIRFDIKLSGGLMSKVGYMLVLEREEGDELKIFTGVASDVRYLRFSLEQIFPQYQIEVDEHLRGYI